MTPFDKCLKRLLDIFFSLAGIILLSPILLLIAVAVKTTSKGPILYRGLRTGRFEKPFRIRKFRTMVTNAESVGGTTTANSDPRITRIGKFLRKYKLDELPQLFDVLIGNMSFVGPRPEVAEYTDVYSDEEKIILSVRPGITDYASIQFRDLQTMVGSENADDVYRQKILPIKNELRIKYVREWSLYSDTKILFTTVFLVLRKIFYKKEEK